jgi:hypothetical protein
VAPRATDAPSFKKRLVIVAFLARLEQADELGFAVRVLLRLLPVGFHADAGLTRTIAGSSARNVRDEGGMAGRW